MKETHEFLIPDYYLQFSCKMGACSAACCVGWPISISMQNYYYLLGVNCSRELLLEKKDPISFSFKKMTVLTPPLKERESFFETLGVEQSIRLHLGQIIQDRSMTLPQRIICLGDTLDRMDIAFTNKDNEALDHSIDRFPTDSRDNRFKFNLDYRANATKGRRAELLNKPEYVKVLEKYK